MSKEDIFYSKMFCLNDEEDLSEYEQILNDLFVNKKAYYSAPSSDKVFKLRGEIFAELEYIEYGEESIGEFKETQRMVPEKSLDDKEFIEVKLINKMSSEGREMYSDIVNEHYKRKIVIERLEEFIDEKMGIYYVYIRIRRDK